MILCLLNVGILQNRYNMAFLQGLIGIVGVDIFRCNSSSFSYSAYMYVACEHRPFPGFCFTPPEKQLLKYKVCISGAAFQEESPEYPYYFSLKNGRIIQYTTFVTCTTSF